MLALVFAAAENPPIPSAEYGLLPVWAGHLAPFSGRFTGQKVFVTGGSSGIGLAAVLGFRMECADVVFAGSSGKKALATYEALPNLPTTCSGGDPKLGWAAGNVANQSEAIGLVAQAIEIMGGLDVAVNCAGMAGVPGVQVGEDRILELLGSSLDVSPSAARTQTQTIAAGCEATHSFGPHAVDSRTRSTCTG